MNNKIIASVSPEFIPKNPDQTLNEIYDSIWQSSKSKILNQKLDFDPYLKDNLYDPRRGLTLEIDLSTNYTPQMKEILEECKNAAPNQSWYLPKNFHLSLYSLLDFNESDQEKTLTAELLQKYQASIESAISSLETFNLSLKGLLATSGTVLVKGYSQGAIQSLRNRINQEFIKRKLPTYNRTKLNHISVLRFDKPLPNPDKFCEFIEKNKETFLGNIHVKSVKLVINDYYNDPAKTMLLKEYNLKKSEF